MAWSESSPSIHAGDVTRGSCFPGISWVEVIPIPLKAWPQLFNISMKPAKGYIYVKWPCQSLAAKLLLCKTALNGPDPCVPSPAQTGRGEDIIYIFFSNISWTPWVLDPITNPYLPPPPLDCTLLQSLYPVPLIYMFVFMPVLLCFDYWSCSIVCSFV